MALFSAVCVAVALTTLFRLSNPAISSYEGREPIAGFAWKNVSLHNLRLWSAI